MSRLLIKLANWIHKKYGIISELGGFIHFNGIRYEITFIQLRQNYGCKNELMVEAKSVN